ncbi:hypothetical protein [Tolypothrix sp. VBCCA 56010]|uniref:hypothetical protein n=1 Tax=Tolypothrix sp. VBCCA 56010 TaxID=3137731 RepID=UPI003D7C3AE1
MGYGGGSAVLGSPQVEHLPSWGMWHGDLKRGKRKRIIIIAHCPMPIAQCPMPIAQCPLPNAHCPLTTNSLIKSIPLLIRSS